VAQQVNIAEGFVPIKSSGIGGTRRDLSQASTGFRNFATTVRPEAAGIKSALEPVIAAFAALKAAKLAFRAVSFGVELAADLKLAELVLTTMLKSAEKARALLDEVRKACWCCSG